MFKEFLAWHQQTTASSIRGSVEVVVLPLDLRDRHHLESAPGRTAATVEVGETRQDTHPVGDRDDLARVSAPCIAPGHDVASSRSEEHTSELQSLMRSSYA